MQSLHRLQKEPWSLVRDLSLFSPSFSLLPRPSPAVPAQPRRTLQLPPNTPRCLHRRHEGSRERARGRMPPLSNQTEAPDPATTASKYNSVGAGDAHSCAGDETGAMTCWGYTKLRPNRSPQGASSHHSNLRGLLAHLRLGHRGRGDLLGRADLEHQSSVP